MNTLHRLSPLLLATVLGLALPRPGAACSCMAGFGTEKPCENYWGTEAHFLGRAISVEVMEGEKFSFWPRRFQFEVLEGYIGVEGPTAEVWTGMGGGDCGYEFKIGQSYLIYAGRTPDGRLHTSICGPTQAASRAGDAIAYARQVAAGTAQSSLYGRVQLEQHRKEMRTLDDGVPNVTINIQGPDGEKFLVVTDREGYFEIKGQLAGKYTLRARTPRGLPLIKPQTVEILPGQCAGALLEVPILGTFTGRIVDLDGIPLKGVTVSLYTIETKGEPPSAVSTVETNSEGVYTFYYHPAGVYLIGTDVYKPLPNFHPGTRELAQAARFRLRQDTTVKLPDFRISREVDDE